MRFGDRRLPDRFWAKVSVDDTTGCWLWQGARNKRSGYGSVADPVKGSSGYAHRFAYRELVGPIPEGLVIDHLCRVRHCVNPDHMEPVTSGENVLRGISPAAMQKRQTHCIHGHEFTPENTYEWRGHRACRTCAAERELRNGKRRTIGVSQIKLTPELVVMIRTSGRHTDDLADELAVSPVTIRQARSGQSWRSIPMPDGGPVRPDRRSAS